MISVSKLSKTFPNSVAKALHASPAPLHTRKVVTFCRERNLPMSSHGDTTVEHVEEALRDGLPVVREVWLTGRRVF